MGIFLYYFVYFYLDQIVYFYFSIISLVTKKDFLSVTEQYLLNEVDNVGKKSIEQLKENGVKFKKEGR